MVSGLVALPSDGTMTRADLWNAVEAKHKRGDATVAREFIVALPDELDLQGRQELANGYARELADRYGVAVDVNIHAPDQHGDQRNHHAHILLSACYCSPDGELGKKAVGLDPIHCQRAGLANVVEVERQRWQDRVNAALSNAGQEARIDHRSLKDQGVEDRLPGVHFGQVGTGMPRRGQVSNIEANTKRQVDEFMSQVQADAAIRTASALDLSELEDQLSRLLDEQSNPMLRVETLKVEIENYRSQNMAEPQARFQAASTALNFSQRRELVEPAHRLVINAQSSQKRAKKVIQETTTELDELPWFQLVRRRSLIKKRQEAEALLPGLQAQIDQNKGMASTPITERCRDALQAAQVELDLVEPGMEALKEELGQLERELEEIEALKKAEVELMRQRIATAKAREQAQSHAQRVTELKDSPTYQKEVRDRQKAVKSVSDNTPTPGR